MNNSNTQFSPYEFKEIESLHKIVSELISDEKFEEVRNILAELHPAEIADLMSGLGALSRNMVFDLSPLEIQHEVLAELEEADQESLLDRMSEAQIGDIIENLDSDDAADIAGLLDEPTRQRVLEATSDEDREEVIQLLNYDEESAGGLMSLEMATVDSNATVKDAINSIRIMRQDNSIEDLHFIYIVDRNLKLLGAVKVLDLLLNDHKRKVIEFSDSDIITVPSNMDQEEVARHFQRYDLISAPVVDENGILVGRITIDDIVDVIHDEAEEDMGYLGGTGEEEVTERNFLKASRSRLPWLLLAFFGELLSVLVISLYEVELKELIIISFFIPVVIAIAGNVGIQSSTIVVRGLATGEIPLYHSFKRVGREVLVGSLNGFVIATLLFLVILVWKHELMVSIAVGVSMICVVIIAAITGSLTPIILKRINQDPAYASGPFITMTNDVLGLTVYMVITIAMLH